MIDKSIIDLYLEDNKNLTLLAGKRPILDNWVDNLPKRSQVENHKGNLGWVIDNNHIIIDIDTRKGGIESYKKLITYLKSYDPDLHLEASVVTPTGGLHVYTSIPEIYIGHKFKKNLREYPGIDFLTKGAQCVIPGSITENGEYCFYDDIMQEYEIFETPEELIDLLIKTNVGETVPTGGLQIRDDIEEALLFQGSSSNWKIDKVRDMLDHLNPSMPYEDWLKVGMALHDWNKKKGLQLWEEWSQDGDNYEEGATEKKWLSFSGGGGVSLGTISYMASEVIFDEERTRVKKYIELIKNAVDDKAIEFNICPKIRKENFKKISKERIVKAIQDRLKQLEGVNLSIGVIRDMVKCNEVEIVQGNFIEENGEIPEWCKQWIFVSAFDGFYDLESLKFNKLNAFNIECGKHVPITEGSGTKPSAFKYVSDRGFIRKVHSTVYMPTTTELILQMEGAKVLNTFNIKTVPIEAEAFTKEGRKAIDMVNRHIEFICSGNKENTQILTQWIAHQVQYPGKKILWAPIIQAIQGVGKSFFAELLRACVGDVNVGTISPTQVVNDFNGWATNRCVNILEELRVKGKNRHDCVNALKPLITDRIIQINDKGVSQFNTYNTANYICFTNHKDAIPLEESDRRWWVLFVEVNNLDQMGHVLGVDINEYFPMLFDYVRTYGDQIRKYFLEYQISNKFMKTNQAPMTKYKKAMIDTETAKYEGLVELKGMIETGGEYYNKEVVCPTELFNEFFLEFPYIDKFNTKQKHFLLCQLGYQANGNPVKLKNKTRRVWTKKPMDNDEIRRSFKDLPFALSQDGLSIEDEKIKMIDADLSKTDELDTWLNEE